MAENEELRCFVGGLSWKTTDRELENAFQRFGRIVEAKVVIDRQNGRSKGFGFVTFANKSDMQDAIDKMYGKELDGRSITVSKAESRPRGGGGDVGALGYSRGDGLDSRRSSGRSRSSVGSNECFKCGQSGHWARECPSEGGGGKGGRYSNGSYSNTRSDHSGGSRGGNYGESRYGSSDSYGKPGGGGSYRESGVRVSRSGPYDRPSGNGGCATRE